MSLRNWNMRTQKSCADCIIKTAYNSFFRPIRKTRQLGISEKLRALNRERLPEPRSFSKILRSYSLTNVTKHHYTLGMSLLFRVLLLFTIIFIFRIKLLASHLHINFIVISIYKVTLSSLYPFD